MPTIQKLIPIFPLLGILAATGCGIYDVPCVEGVPKEANLWPCNDETGGEEEPSAECVDGEVPMFDASRLCSHSADALIEDHNYTNESIQALFPGTWYGHLWPSAPADPNGVYNSATPYACLVDSDTPGKVSMASPEETPSWQFGDHTCVVDHVQAEDLVADRHPGTHHAVLRENRHTLCFDTLRVEGAWPGLRLGTEAYPGLVQFLPPEKLEGIFSSGELITVCPGENDESMVMVTSPTNGDADGGLLCNRLNNCSLPCYADADCWALESLADQAYDENQVDAYCILPPLDSQGSPAACGLVSLGKTVPLNPDTILALDGIELPWNKNVHCDFTTDREGDTWAECFVTQVLFKELLTHPNALTSGAFPKLDESTGYLVFDSPPNESSVVKWAGLGEDDAVVGIGARGGVPGDFDSLAEAFGELLRGSTELRMERADGTELVFIIEVVDGPLLTAPQR